jgi:hypothetical protein
MGSVIGAFTDGAADATDTEGDNSGADPTFTEAANRCLRRTSKSTADDDLKDAEPLPR